MLNFHNERTDSIMLCQNCGRNEANTHIKQVLNGEMVESHLCSDCANHLGYTDIFSGFGFNISGFFSGLLSDMIPANTLGNIKRCEKCGCSFDDIVREGKVGCAECYKTFYDRLEPSIQRIHGKIKYSGKAAANAPRKEREESPEEKIAKLKEQMSEAVEKQEFEQAAKLRDEIRALEGEING